MTDKPLVSIIIPTYNRAVILKTALESAIAQTYPNKQIIVVDDGSKDDTAALTSQYPQVEYLFKHNGGQASARNYGLAAAKGKYIASLDSDDRWDTGFVATCVEKLEKDDLDFVFTNWYQQENKDDDTKWRNPFGDYVFLKPYLNKQTTDNWIGLGHNELRELYLYNCPSPSSSVIVRRSSFVNGWNTQMKIGDDWCMLLDIVLSKESKAAFSQKQLWYKYRDGTNIYDGRNPIEVLSVLYVADIRKLIDRNKAKLTPNELEMLDKRYIQSLMMLAKHYLITNHDVRSFTRFFAMGIKIWPLETLQALFKLFFEGLSSHIFKAEPKAAW